MMKSKKQTIVVTDASVLINFLAINRMDLIAGHHADFFVTDHVADEITYLYPERLERFQKTIALGIVTQISVRDPDEVELFGNLKKGSRLGNGECSAMAVSLHRGYALAIDDKRAINVALSLSSEIIILKTQDLLLDCIHAGLLDLACADEIKDELANCHNFKLKIGSFQDLLNN